MMKDITLKSGRNRFSINVVFWTTLMMLLFTMTGCKKKDDKQTDYSAVKAKITKSIEANMKKYDMTGVSIALVDGDAKNPVVWSQGFGFADKENKIPATPNTVYRAGSITKLFTGMAIMQLAEQGKLDIEKPVQTYLPNLKINSHFTTNAPVTIRNMLTHHSGLPSEYAKNMRVPSTANLQKLTKLSIDLASKPNTQHSYSNLAFELLGQVIENVSGLSYENYIQQKLLTPMGMSQSHVHKTLVANTNHAKGYYEGKNHPIPSLRGLPDGNLNSSVLDLAKFAQMTFPKQSKKVLSDASLQKMQSPQFTSNSPFVNNNHGLAWSLNDGLKKITKGRSGMIVGHDGATELFNSAFFTLPKHKLAVVVMTNSQSINGSGLNDIASELLAKAFETKTKITIDAQPAFKLPNIKPTTQNDLKNMQGVWSNGSDTMIPIEAKNGRLVLNMNGKKVPLVNRGNATYYLDHQSAGLSAEDIGSNATLGLKYHKNTDTEAIELLQSNVHQSYLEKLSPQQLSESWGKRLGNYQLVNKGNDLASLSDVQLVYKDGLLVLTGRHNLLNVFAKQSEFVYIFKTINNDKAHQYGVGRNTGFSLTFKKAPDGNERMYFVGYEFKKVS